MNPSSPARLLFLLVACVLAAAASRAADPSPRDLAPVTMLPALGHGAVEIVRDGAARAVVHVAVAQPSPKLGRLVAELVEVVRLSTGATLDVVAELPADRPAIVIGDCAESRRAGIDAAALAVEGFAVKTAADRVFLVGSTQPLPPGSDRWAPWANEGDAWAVADFLERFVGVRWYWPASLGGRTIERRESLAVPAVHYRDQPAFRMREFHPADGWKLPTQPRWFDKEPLPFPAGAIPEGVDRIDLAGFLPLVREGNSWPYRVKVHEPQKMWKQWDSTWSKRPEDMDMFQQGKDGKRKLSMFCYSSPKTLAYLLDGCEQAWDKGKHASWVTPTCVTVSPGDFPLDCQCPQCRETTRQGGASLVMGLFVKRMCEEVKRRWPDKKVIYLPYWNYQKCPEQVDYPDNLTVMACTTGGPMALMRQPAARRATEANLRAWSRKVGGPICTWDYTDRGSGWTLGPVQYPHLVQDFHRANKGMLAGSFLNGGFASDWTTSAPTLYVWMKALWNPDIDVDAVLDEMCRRLYGKAGGTARELLRLECRRWEEGEWPRHLGDDGRIPADLFQAIWPPEAVAEMKSLRDKALAETADDPVARQRLLYWTWTFDAFLAAAAETSAAARPEKGKAPNVVLIVSDDQHWRDYGFMGHEHLRTPHLDRLARESRVYRRGYVTSSLCCPSLASVITGRYPHEHRIVGNDPPGGKDAFAAGRERMNEHLAEWPTLPRLLAARGFLSLQTGKWWQGDFSRGGFTAGMTKGGRHGDEGLAIGRTTLQPIYDFIGRCRRDGKPFFIWYAPMLPHDPHDPPADLVEHYAAKTDSLHVARYWGNVERFDRTVGDLLDHLDREQLARDTLVVYVTDNGWIQDPQAARFAPRSKLSPYDGGLRTPIMLRRPGTIEPKTSDALASAIDIAPTVLAACGVEPPEGLPGVNLLDEQAVAGRKQIFGECYTHTIVDLDDPAKSLLWRWTVTDRWKLIVPATAGGESELFDIAADPAEATNLAAARPEIVRELSTSLDGWWTP